MLFKLFLIITFSLISYIESAESKVYFQHNLGYSSNTDAELGSSHTTMRNLVFIGGTFGKGDNFVIGQSAIIWNVSNTRATGGTAATISLLELGPRLVWYLNDTKTFNISVAWHPYVSGDRTPSSTVAETVKGSSIMGSMGYELKITKTFYMGASIIYHSMTLSEATVGTTVSPVAQAYVSMIPTLEMSYRFK